MVMHGIGYVIPKFKAFDRVIEKPCFIGLEPDRIFAITIEAGEELIKLEQCEQ